MAIRRTNLDIYLGKNTVMPLGRYMTEKTAIYGIRDRRVMHGGCERHSLLEKTMARDALEMTRESKEFEPEVRVLKEFGYCGNVFPSVFAISICQESDADRIG